MKHGGDLAEAVKRFGLPLDDWIDLSTGINPDMYPVRPSHPSSWGALPQSAALRALQAAARRCYATPKDAPVLAAPGTQIVIQLLPIVRPARRVAIVGVTYSEHARCWERSGAAVEFIDGLYAPQDADILVAVNPNNPDGRVWTPAQLRDCHERMAARGGLLVIDEAFADIAPEVSLAEKAGTEGLIILRSFGKFFGLAGLRLGFALGPAGLLAKLEELMGPWAVSGIALDVGRQALDDRLWQQSARARCYQISARLDDVLSGAGFEILGGTALFRLARHPRASEIHERLASRGIWTRRFENRLDWLRFGLPRDAAAFDRLSAALAEPM